jgi:TetR/AcrR family transcriptional repressor of nem operon
MARSSREQTSKNREAIEIASARLFREHGLDGISVAELMGAAGLTHGGFYSHFASKDDLAAVACARGFRETDERWNQRMARADGDMEAARASIVTAYLRDAHRDEPGSGCVGTAMATDVARAPADKPIHQAYVDGFKTAMLDNWMKTLADDEVDPVERRKHALRDLSMLVGSMLLARATAGDPVSDDILAAVREALLPAPTQAK